MVSKKKVILKCECGKNIIGFSQKHAEINMQIHIKTSIRHQDIMKLLKEKGMK